jgi:hypothetical protein
MEVLFVSHNGLTEALGGRQVLPYLVGLGMKGWRFSVLSFEKPETADASARERVASALAGVGATWTRLPYHRRPPSSPRFSTWHAALSGRDRGRPDRRSFMHAQRYPPHWLRYCAGATERPGFSTRHGLRSRIVDHTERRLLRGADALVFLTRRIATDLAAYGTLRRSAPTEIIPCTADLSEFKPDAAYRAAAQQVAFLLTRREEATRAARVLAGREFGLAMAIERYDRLYRRVLADGP